MLRHFLTFCGLLFLSAIQLQATEPGGITARFIPDEVRPGDLAVLSIEMNRSAYGRFDLEVPSHPLIHLVSREPTPLQISEGRYHQRERLVLQALISGPLTLSGIQVKLTETSGTRTLELPELTLNVIPFAAIDESESPEPFPTEQRSTTSYSALITHLFLLTTIGVLVYIICRKAPTCEEETILPIQALSEGEFEALLENNRDNLSAKLRSDLEAIVYARKSSEMASLDLLTRLRKELGR